MSSFISKKKSLESSLFEDNTIEEVEKASVFTQEEKQKEVRRFIEENPRWSLDEIILNPDTREIIDEVVIFCQNRERLINQWGLNKFLKGNSSIGINLYGESGTGKSITAEAIAAALNKKIIKVDYSEIQDSKWGATEKNLTILFKTAEKNDRIIFMDEADGLLSKRSTNDSNANAANEIKSHLLTLIDRSNVIIIYATNLFKNFDRAFFRRILYHIKYPMPSKEELVDLWKFHLGNENIPKDPTGFSYGTIAEMSEDILTGGDIRNITLKLCVKLAAGKVTCLTNAVIQEEINRFKESLADSKGARVVPKEEQDNKEENK